MHQVRLLHHRVSVSCPVHRSRSASKLKVRWVYEPRGAGQASTGVPLRALDFGEVDDLLARHADTTSDVVPLPSSEYTTRHLYMRLSPAGESTRMGDGFIANSQEIENNHENSSAVLEGRS